MAVELLQRVGLNKYEAEAYVALLADGPLTGYELGKRSNVPLSKSYETLERLTRRGLALIQPGDPPRYLAERPERFLAHTRSEQDVVLGALASALTGIQRADPADDFWVLRGRANILTRARALIDEAEREVLLGSTGADDSIRLAIEGARARGCTVSTRHLGDLGSPELIALLADGRVSLIGTLSPDGHCQAVTSANPALALAVRGALSLREIVQSTAPVRLSETAATSADRGTDWLAWETRKQQRLWRMQQGRRPA